MVAVFVAKDGRGGIYAILAGNEEGWGCCCNLWVLIPFDFSTRLKVITILINFIPRPDRTLSTFLVVVLCYLLVVTKGFGFAVVGLTTCNLFWPWITRLCAGDFVSDKV